MALTIEKIRTALRFEAERARRKFAYDYIEAQLREALVQVDAARRARYGEDAKRYLARIVADLENAEALIAYLQDPTIIDQPERNLPA